MIFKNKEIKGVGKFLQEHILTNQNIEVFVPETTHEWIYKNLGIRERHIAHNNTVVNMGDVAACIALENAKLNISDIDAVIVSCSSPSHFAPSISNQIINKLGIEVPAFDINAVCSGFIFSLEIACHMLESNGYNNILIVATEKYSDITDWRNRNCVYFGDGAGAVIVSKGEGTIITNIYSDGKSDDAFVAKSGKFYDIIGGKVYKKAVEVLPDAIKKILVEANMSIDDIDYMIPHQAGINVLIEIAKKVNLPMKKCITVMDKYANLASASIPIGLCEIENIKNKNLLLVAIGSGWTYGTAIIIK